MRIGLVGYGVGGRYFHAPFMAAADGVELVGVVARAPERIAEVGRDLPGVHVYGSLGALLDSGVDAVTISTPPHTRRELVLEAVGRGVHVVADKPFAPTAEGAAELVAEAAQAEVLLSVFHNRRWDTDVLDPQVRSRRRVRRTGVAVRIAIRTGRAGQPGGRPDRWVAP